MNKVTMQEWVEEGMKGMDATLERVQEVQEQLFYACCCGCTEPPVKPIDHPDVWPSCPDCGMV